MSEARGLLRSLRSELMLHACSWVVARGVRSRMLVITAMVPLLAGERFIKCDREVWW